MPLDTAEPLLAMRGIRKSFGGTPVLHGVNLDLYAGEVLALLGENGAGKSTLIKILNGDYSRDAGEIYLEGRKLNPQSPHEARQAGIQVIYQELNSAADLSVAENVMLGHLPARRGLLGWGRVDWKAANRSAAEILQMLDCRISPTTPMRRLGVGERQLVEIAKALSTKARVLVMDEPTAALTPRETGILLETIKRLRESGVGIIYISHRLEEVERAAQRVMVLRDGKVAGVVTAENFDRGAIVRMMVGRELTGSIYASRACAAEPALKVIGLGRLGVFSEVTFSVAAGEIVGLFGLLGAGHMELVRALFGAESANAGRVEIGSKRFRPRSPRQARSHGLGLVPEDRKTEGFVAGMTVAENLTLGNWREVSTAGVVRRSRQTRRAEHWIGRLAIRGKRGASADVDTLSGGNQQKVVLARWLEAGTRILLLNEPTRGVDVGARADIYALLDELRKKGMCVLMASSDLEEVLSVSDRILVFRKGRVAAEIDHQSATPERLLSAATGGET